MCLFISFCGWFVVFCICCDFLLSGEWREKTMRTTRKEAGGPWLGHSDHFWSLVGDSGRSEEINNLLSQKLIWQDNKSLSSWGKVSEKLWGWKHEWAIKLSSPTLNCKRQHYGSSNCLRQLGFQTKTILLKFWFRFHFSTSLSHFNIFMLGSLFAMSFQDFLILIVTFINMPMARMILGENSL